ncbi:MAG TPA: SSI family serine proteinase inhibitor [Streptosporangiaceae bacterium]|nr:SSI family serine proteinase inhibitor [Streptosporangiaceae bacterium]
MAMTSFLRTAGTQPRYRMLLTRGALIAVCGIAAVGCGSVAAPSSASGGASHSTSPAGTTSAAKVSLSITLTGSGTASPAHWTLQCEPTGGTAPDAATACSELLQMKTVLLPQPVKVMCPMIIANARSYVVSGTYLGHSVHESIIDGGCDLARWTDLNRIFY